MNILMCSAGRRCELIKDIRKSISEGSKIVATDNSKYAPALYLADNYYLVPRIDAPDYVDRLLEICKKEAINVITTFIDPEILVLARNRKKFESLGVEVLAPYTETAELCFDKYKMYEYLREKGIRTVKTWGTYEEVEKAVLSNNINFPLFMKPRTGSGSVGAQRVDNLEIVKEKYRQDKSLIVQEYMDGEDIDADIYIDTITHMPVSVFSKKKISTTLGGANKTISFKDEKLFNFIMEFIPLFKFNGPIDADFFYKDGVYYLSEINPRFGGGYLHAYGAGVDFIKMIEKNIQGKKNDTAIGDYEDDIVMMMYDSVVIKKI